MRPCNRDKEEVCIKERKSISLVERRKRKDI